MFYIYIAGPIIWRWSISFSPALSPSPQILILLAGAPVSLLDHIPLLLCGILGTWVHSSTPVQLALDSVECFPRKCPAIMPIRVVLMRMEVGQLAIPPFHIHVNYMYISRRKHLNQNLRPPTDLLDERILIWMINILSLLSHIRPPMDITNISSWCLVETCHLWQKGSRTKETVQPFTTALTSKLADLKNLRYLIKFFDFSKALGLQVGRVKANIQNGGFTPSCILGLIWIVRGCFSRKLAFIPLGSKGYGKWLDFEVYSSVKTILNKI